MMTHTSVDYGEEGPEDFDRFGIRLNATVSGDDRVTTTFRDANVRGIVKRLGLTLFGGYKRWPGMEVFRLEVWGRPLEIRSYSDGRIKLFLDGQPVYAEKTKIVTRHGVKHREVEQWFDPAEAEEEREAAKAAAEEEREAERQRRIEETRARLQKHLEEIRRHLV
jgi:hypothetical protein